MTLLKDLKAGGWAEKSLTTTEGGDITVSDSVFCADYNRFYVIISNADTTGDARNYTATLTVTKKNYITFSHNFASGWNLVGVPFVPAYEEPDRALNFSGALQLKLGKYVLGDDRDPTGPGMAYWAYFSASHGVAVMGETSTTDTVALSPGWNLISLPQNTNSNWSASVLLMTDTGSMNIDAADTVNYVKPFLYSYDPATDQFSNPIGITDGHVMTPWKGYAIYALQPCSLKFVF